MDKPVTLMVFVFLIIVASAVSFIKVENKISGMEERLRSAEEKIAELEIPDDKMAYGEYRDYIQYFNSDNVVWGSRRDRISQSVVIQTILDHLGLEIERVPSRKERFRLSEPEKPALLWFEDVR